MKLFIINSVILIYLSQHNLETSPIQLSGSQDSIFRWVSMDSLTLTGEDGNGNSIAPSPVASDTETEDLGNLDALCHEDLMCKTMQIQRSLKKYRDRYMQVRFNRVWVGGACSGVSPCASALGIPCELLARNAGTTRFKSHLPIIFVLVIHVKAD